MSTVDVEAVNAVISTVRSVINRVVDTNPGLELAHNILAATNLVERVSRSSSVRGSPRQPAIAASIEAPLLRKSSPGLQVPTPLIPVRDDTPVPAVTTASRRDRADLKRGQTDEVTVVASTRGTTSAHKRKEGYYKDGTGVGEKDSNSDICAEGGWYYEWWGGIHCLMGKEGVDAGRYLIRPSYEKFLVAGLGWNISGEATVQMASGDLGDSTFEDYKCFISIKAEEESL
ncbi:hypothetical protein MMC19_000751 [Ptychographa xylographoides]|nr:hypothetical protein [Ptychographa xylographoides]